MVGQVPGGGLEDSLDLRSESRYSVLTSTMIRITIDFREKNVAADHRSVSKSLRCSAVSYSPVGGGPGTEPEQNKVEIHTRVEKIRDFRGLGLTYKQIGERLGENL